MDLKVAAAFGVGVLVGLAWPAVHTLIEAVREGTGSKYRRRGRKRRRD
jgi:hypothetical protein